MINKRILAILFVVLLGIPGFADPQATKDAPALVVCYTAGSVNRRQAKKATTSMLTVMERLAGIPIGTYQGKFTSKTQECLDLLKDKGTHFISPTLGFFLKYRKQYHLRPVAFPKVHGRTQDRWYIIVRKGAYTDIQSLKGKTIGGPLVEDAEFLRRIVFKNKIDPAKFFVLKHSSRALRALRRLARGKLDAVIVDQQQYDALPSLPFAKDFTVVFKSDPMPVPSILAVGKRTTKKDVRLFTKALSGFCKDPKGKPFCDLFGIDTFVPAKKDVYHQVEALWNAGNKK